jgi:hypothetical protein
LFFRNSKKSFFSFFFFFCDDFRMMLRWIRCPRRWRSSEANGALASDKSSQEASQEGGKKESVDRRVAYQLMEARVKQMELVENMRKAAALREQEKGHESQNNWSWAGPRAYLLVVATLWAIGNYTFVTKRAEWKEQECEAKRLENRLLARIHDLESSQTHLSEVHARKAPLYADEIVRALQHCEAEQQQSAAAVVADLLQRQLEHSIAEPAPVDADWRHNALDSLNTFVHRVVETNEHGDVARVDKSAALEPAPASAATNKFI